MAHRVSHSGGSSRQAPRGPGHIAVPVRGRRPALAPRDGCRGGSASRPRTTAGELLSPDAPAPRLSRSWPTSFDSLRLEQLRQPLARVEHARLDRVLRNANDLGCLCDRFLVVVYQIDDLPMFRRKSCEALSKHCTLILLLQRGCGIVRQSSIATAASSSNSASRRRLSAEMALKRAIASNHVDTVARPSNRPA